ncbi:MAG: PIN domain-containing protein [Candidatus Diapherotrites archaeon]
MQKRIDGMTVNRYLLDTSAWIEYFDGTPAGEKVKGLLDSSSNECFTCGIVLCEVASKLMRKGFVDTETYYSFIKSKVRFVDVASDDYFNAGVRHAVLKKEDNRISYTDALLVVLSETRKVRIVSKDEHLKKHDTLFLR